MAEPDVRSVALRLKERKRELEDLGRWTGQRPIALALGVTEQAVSQWFTGAHDPDRDHAGPLARFLGVNTEWLVWGTGPKYPEVVSHGARMRIEPHTGEQGNGTNGG